MKCLTQIQSLEGRQVVIVLLLLASMASPGFTANSSTTFKFLLMVASRSKPNSSAVVSALDQTVKEINMNFPFQLKYDISDSQVSEKN